MGGGGTHDRDGRVRCSVVLTDREIPLPVGKLLPPTLQWWRQGLCEKSDGRVGRTTGGLVATL